MIEDVLKAHARRHEAGRLVIAASQDLSNPAKLDAAKALMAQASADYEKAYSELTADDICRLAQALLKQKGI